MKNRNLLSIILLALLLVAPCMSLDQTQAAWLEGVHFGMKFGYALEEAALNGNITGYNLLVQEYNDEINRTLPLDEAKNEWLALKQNAAVSVLPPLFGEKSPQSIAFTKQPFNSSSALGQFGKQRVLDQPINPPAKELRDQDAKNAQLTNFLRD
jgi:hypothetical protein